MCRQKPGTFVTLPDRSKKSDIPDPIHAVATHETEEALARKNIYHLLSKLFMREVTPDLLQALTSEDMLAGFHELGVDMRTAVALPNEKLLNDLAEEYAALFIVPGGLSPYESVRLHGMLNQKPAWEVQEFYRQCGLVIKDDCRILPDHFGMELEFMGYLVGREAGASPHADDKETEKWSRFQADFFQGHIRPWAFDFLRDLQSLAFHPFYKGVADLAMRFLEAEREHLGIPNEGDGGRLEQDIVNRFV